MKEDYLREIREAGFENVRIVGETTFPLNDLLGHPAVQERLGNAERLKEQVEEVGSSIASTKVQAEKPTMPKGN
jgi:hypothetical protein